MTYRMEGRRAAADRTRARVIRAARRLLLGRDEGKTRFSLEAVARAAGVTRRTVYLQFGSRHALLEAVFDQLATGLVRDLPEVFRERDPEAALARLIAAFGKLWSTGRVGHRRLRAQGVLDRELGRALERRQARRLHGLRVILGRLGKEDEELVAALYALTSFEMFDVLAGPSRSPREVVPQVLRLARRAIGL
jgi:AcrR family transcriptional regulator